MEKKNKTRLTRRKAGAIGAGLAAVALAAGCDRVALDIRAGGAMMVDPKVQADTRYNPGENPVRPTVGLGVEADYGKNFVSADVNYFNTELDDGFARVKTDHALVNAEVGRFGSGIGRFYSKIGLTGWVANGNIKIPTIAVDDDHTTTTWGAKATLGYDIGKGVSLEVGYTHWPDAEGEKGMATVNFKFTPKARDMGRIKRTGYRRNGWRNRK